MPIDLSIELRLAYLRAAQAAQEETESDIQTYRDFFDGEQGVKLTDRQKEYLSQDVESFGNICKRTVAIPKDRLEIDEDGIAPQADDAQAYAQLATDWWLDNLLNSEQKEVYEGALRDGNTAIVVGWDDTNNRPTFTQNLVYDGATGNIRFHYDHNNKLLFASKRWTTWNPLEPGATGKRRLTIYRPGLIERFEADGRFAEGWRFLSPRELVSEENPDGLPNPQFWTEDGTADGEPIGIPVIPFDNPGGSELADVVTIQEVLNRALGDLDIATDHHGFPLLWVKDAQLPRDSATGKSEIPDWGPAQAILLGADGAAGRVEVADLAAMFAGGVISWFQVLSIVKGWPLYLFDRSQNPPSGIALQVMEAPLIKQVEDKQVVFGEAWRKAFDIARKLHRLKGGEGLAGDLKFTWKDPRTVDEKAHFEAQKEKWEGAQVPILQRWREAGYTMEQITQMMEDKRREDEFGLADVVTGIEQ